MPWRSQFEPSNLERIIAGLCYFTFGIAGLIYMLLKKGGAQSNLFRFHMYQAVFLSILSVMASWALGPLFSIFFQILGAVAPGAVATTGTVLGFVFDVVGKAFYLLLLYGAVMAFLGKFAEVPYISGVVRQNMMRF
jgi:uncharacterized membrane protein